MTEQIPVEGRNGVVIRQQRSGTGEGYRTYEVHQRERVGQSTEKIKPIQLLSDDYLHNPYPLLEILRENYPCYRDWLGNCYWMSRYNDVTSVFTDDANFETRPKLWFYGMETFGRDLGAYPEVVTAFAQGMDNHVEEVATRLSRAMLAAGNADLARDFAARLPLEILAGTLGISNADREHFFSRYWQAQRGTGWRPDLQVKGRVALTELADYFTGLLAQRKKTDDANLLSVLAGLDVEGGPVTGADVAVTLLERDHETVHGATANLWYLLLTHEAEYAKARSAPRMMKLAYLEALRYCPPVLGAPRFTRHEVERFGRLLPQGALVVCSAAAANRDPRVFTNPNSFVVDRPDLCQREPRGQYRADGLASGIALGLGKPSIHPAVPEDRPRSLYALTRDTVVTASMVLVENIPDLELREGATPGLRALTIGEMHTCWQLPVRVG